jgi:hypothetical protein
MADDPNEVEKFKKVLAKHSLEEIQRRLDRSLIVRPWKRDLAEAEGARRKQEANASKRKTQRDAEIERVRLRDMSRSVWVLVGVAIIFAVVLIWVLFPR